MLGPELSTSSKGVKPYVNSISILMLIRSKFLCSRLFQASREIVVQFKYTWIKFWEMTQGTDFEQQR